MPKRGSCGSVLPGCRLSKQYPSINSPGEMSKTTINKFMLGIVAFGLVVSAVALGAIILLTVGK